MFALIITLWKKNGVKWRHPGVKFNPKEGVESIPGVKKKLDLVLEYRESNYISNTKNKMFCWGA